MIEDEEVADPSQVKVHEILHTGTCGLSDAVQIAFLLQQLKSIFYKKEFVHINHKMVPFVHFNEF